MVSGVRGNDEFLMDIGELGEEYTERFSLDEDSNTITITVPHHMDVDAMTYVHDFNRNLTMRYLPETAECFLSTFSSVKEAGVVPPHEMKKILLAAKHQERRRRSNNDNDDDETVVVLDLRDWAEGDELDEEEVDALSPVVRDACPTGRFRWLFEVHDTAHVRSGRAQTYSGNRHNLLQTLTHRRKRQIVTSQCHPDNLKARCLIKRKGCAHVATDYETCDKKFLNSQTKKTSTCKKVVAHHLEDIYCCRECCDDPKVGDDDFLPYCGNYRPSCSRGN